MNIRDGGQGKKTQGRPKQVLRADGTKWCDFHLQWEPVSDFTPFSQKTGILRYSPRCRLAEQTIGDQKRAIDPAGAAVITRAKKFAAELSKALGCGISYHWVLDELLWVGLIPFMRAAIGPGGSCLNCGTRHDDPRSYQLDHGYPPDSITDWAAQHARNLWIVDGCNQKKGRRDRDREYLDAQHRDWMRHREWALHAGEEGWPPYDPLFGPLPQLIRAEGPVDRDGNPTLFDWQQEGL